MSPNPREAQPSLRKVLETYNSRRPEAFDALLTEDCMLVRDGVEVNGREAVKRTLAQLYRAVPDLEYRIDDALSAGDKMAIRWEGHGTHRGEYMGISPTGRAMSYAGITIYEMRGGRVARIWVSTNLLERLRSLAEVAAPAPSRQHHPIRPSHH